MQKLLLRPYIKNQLIQVCQKGIFNFRLKMVLNYLHQVQNPLKCYFPQIRGSNYYHYIKQLPVVSQPVLHQPLNLYSEVIPLKRWCLTKLTSVSVVIQHLRWQRKYLIYLKPIKYFALLICLKQQVLRNNTIIYLKSSKMIVQFLHQQF